MPRRPPPRSSMNKLSRPRSSMTKS
jgi:hypothetical protein